MAWLKEHPEHTDAFRRRLEHVCADELTLVRETTAIRVSSRPFVQRCFGFAREYVAVIEWNHAERSVRVQELRPANPPPAAA